MSATLAPFCLPGLGVAALRLEAGLDLRLLLGLARFACPPPDGLSGFPLLLLAAPLPVGKGCWPLLLLLPPLLPLLLPGRVKLGGACPMAFSVVGLRPCWSKPLFKLGCLGGRGMLILGGNKPAIEALSLSGDRLISEGSVLGGRLVGVRG